MRLSLLGGRLPSGPVCLMLSSSFHPLYAGGALNCEKGLTPPKLLIPQIKIKIVLHQIAESNVF
jgi:hypothetical protein